LHSIYIIANKWYNNLLYNELITTTQQHNKLHGHHNDLYPGFELSNMNWRVDDFLHVQMSRPEFLCIPETGRPILAKL